MFRCWIVPVVSQHARLTAITLGIAGMLFTAAESTSAQDSGSSLRPKPSQTQNPEATARLASHLRPVHRHNGCDCPCQVPTEIVDPDPANHAPDGLPASNDPDDLLPADFPAVADLSSDASFAGAPQSAAPFAIGDSLGHGGYGVLTYDSGIGGKQQMQICPAGGRRFKAAHNNSPVPTNRLFYSFQYFNDSIGASNGGVSETIDLTRHEFGLERTLWCGLASVQLTVPFSNTIDSHTFQAKVLPVARNTEFGNTSLALKGMLYQDACLTVSAGLAFDLPTASDIIFEDGDNSFVFENESVTISPYLAYLQHHSADVFSQGFIQFALPANENTVRSRYNIQAPTVTNVEEIPLLHLDLSVGAWLFRDCCTGNGWIAIAELHYTTSLDSGASVASADLNTPATINANYQTESLDLLNATIGSTIVTGCWDLTTAVVVPLRDEPDRFFDWEFALQVNRRF